MFLSIKEHIEIHVLIYKYFTSIGNIKYANLTALSIRYLSKSSAITSYLNKIDHNSDEYAFLINNIATNALHAAKANRYINVGKIWVNNGCQNKFVFPDNIPDGYTKGKLIKDRKKFCNKMKIVNKGKTKYKKWYHNNDTNIFIDATDPIPEGFISGLKRHKKQKSYKHDKGYIYITNGKQNIRIMPNDPIPKGFRKGKTMKSYSMSQETCHKISERNKNRIWITNGIENKFVNKNCIPEGYHKGRKYKHHKSSSVRNFI